MSYNRSTDKRKTLSGWPTLFLTLMVCLLCWAVGFFQTSVVPLERQSAVIPLWNLLAGLLRNPVVSCSLSLIFFTFSAFIIQRISDNEVLIRERTRLPFLLFMLLVSTNGQLFSFSEISIVLLCLVGVIYELFISYHLPDATGRFFNAGFFIGLAGLLIPQVLWFIPLLWIGMYRFRSLNVKGFSASLTGILIVYWFVLGWCVWAHDFSPFVTTYTALTDFTVFPLTSLFRYYQIGFLGIILMLLMAFFYIQIDALNNSVRVRQMLFYLFYVSVWALFLVFLYGNRMDSFLAILFLFSSVLIAYTLEMLRFRIRFALYYAVLALWTVSFLIRIWSIS
jgi:hypothetical protein